MFVSVLASVLVMAYAPADTTVSLGSVQRDLTGDGVPETLTLTGRGHTIDSLDLRFTITSAGRTVYEKRWSVTRVIGFDAGRRTLSAVEHRARLNELGSAFFAPAKFMSPDGFLAKLRASARGHIALIPEVIARDGGPQDSSQARLVWDGMQTAGITIFEFSAGGDAVTTIGWSRSDHRFYRLLECC